MTRSLVGKHITAFVPGEGRVSGVVESEDFSPSRGEMSYLITNPDDGRRAIEVAESEIRETRDGLKSSRSTSRSRPKLLDLFCGAGGAAKGYYEAGFDVLGVDVLPQPEYPFEFIQADAIEFLDRMVAGGTFEWRGRGLFAAVHASPPCQRYTRLKVMPTARDDHPDLLQPTIDRLLAWGIPFAVENVEGAPYPPDLYRVMLCGSHFGLRLRRHRWFVTNVAMLGQRCQHDPNIDVVGVYGASDGSHEPGFKHPGIRRGPRQATTVEAREVMGMPWVTKRKGLTNAIPPAYAQFIGGYLMAALERPNAA